MTNLIIGLALITAALAVAIRSHLDKRNQRMERRKQLEQRLREYPLDCFPREHYELGPLDMIIVRDLVDKR